MIGEITSIVVKQLLYQWLINQIQFRESLDDVVVVMTIVMETTFL